MMKHLLILLASISSACAFFDVPVLTPETYNSLTEGKTVFIKFFAPMVSTKLVSTPFVDGIF